MTRLNMGCERIRKMGKIGKTVNGFYCYIKHGDGFASYIGVDDKWFCPVCQYPGSPQIKFFKTEKEAILSGKTK